jgi:hypothetical protein
MKRTVSLACVAVLLVLAPLIAQQGKWFSKIQTLEVYEIRPGILMMPRYTDDGDVCEVGIERIRYSPNLISRNTSLSREEIDQIVDELAPPGERGPKPKGLFGYDDILQMGNGYTTIETYENVSVEIYGDASHKCNQGILAATIKWNKRKCKAESPSQH